MRIADTMMAELEYEAVATRRVLGRVPQEHLAWRPHPRSMSLGQLALHVATIPGRIAEMASADMSAPPPGEQTEATRSADLLPAFEDSLVRARKALSTMDDATLMTMWRMMAGERELVAMPRVALLRNVMLNHFYHHRGQLLVYLRMHDVPIPSVYGPTADENPFAQPAS